MITSRGLWWALAAAAVAVAAVVFVRRSRTPYPALPDERPALDGPPPERDTPPPWPPVPILGTPTKADIERYATRPAGFFDHPAVAAFFADRQPLDGPTRRRLNRWAMVALAVVLLAGGAQVLESAVFSKGGEAATEAEYLPCAQVYADAGVGCATEPQWQVDSGSEPDIEWSPALEPADQQRAESQEPPLAQETVDADCRPRTAKPHVRAINPKVTRAVNRQWRRIETWLKANAPRSYRTLGGPGRARTIAVAEAQTGLSFPDDLRASLLRHNGSAGTEATWPFGFLGNVNATIRQIRDEWRTLCQIDATDDSDDPRTEWWDGRMIPVGSDGTGNSLVVDSVRRDVGKTEHAGNMSFTPGGIRIRSYHALLKATADALETGGTVGSWKPEATAGQLEWNLP
ncbi:SMI1/KNR4 family protein [Nonomuraea sp. NPDC049758]|uniref:SMI1/KNR4 family protein n=1 Tax=Nonomuraea sp. NPDC049758 TaxID=3154360 RepID=UPI00342A81BA